MFGEFFFISFIRCGTRACKWQNHRTIIIINIYMAQISMCIWSNAPKQYSRTSLIRTPKGQSKVSVLERCPFYRGHEYGRFERSLMPLKQRGFADFPITIGFSLPPAAFTKNAHVITGVPSSRLEKAKINYLFIHKCVTVVWVGTWPFILRGVRLHENRWEFERFIRRWMGNKMSFI